MALDFSAYLNTPVEEFEAPKAPPTGHYFATVKGYKTGEKSYDGGATKVAIITLMFQLTSADDDVDMTGFSDKELKAAMVSRDYDLTGATPKQYILRDIAEKALNLPTKGLSLGDTLNAMKNQPCKVYLEQRNYTAKDGEERTVCDVKKVLAAE